MNNNNKNFILNLFGSDVDFSAIATDNVPEENITERILEEKASILLYKKELSGKLQEYMHETKMWNVTKSAENCNSYYSYVKDSLMYRDINTILYVLGSDNKMYGKIICDNKQIRKLFPEEGRLCPKIMSNSAECNDRSFNKYLTFFNPRRKEFFADVYEDKSTHEIHYSPNWVPHWHKYVGDFKTIPLSFKFNDESGFGDMFIYKCYGVNNHRFIKLYYPLSFVRIQNDCFWATIPRTDKQHLLNLDKIKKTSTVIICTSLEDAWSLQNANKYDNEVSFTDFRCEDFDQVDFSPLKDKNVVFFVSNCNSISLAEKCLEADELSSYLIENKIISLDKIRFVLREIKYPSIENVWTFEDLLSLYIQQPPMIKADSLILYTKEEFDKCLNAAKNEIERKATESIDKPFYLSKKNEINDSNDSTEVKSVYDKMIIRPILYEGTVTVLSARAKTGKSRFTLKLCKLLITEKSRESAITGMAIKKCYRESEGKKCAVYLAYDGNISGDIESIKKNDFNNSELFIPIRADELSYLPKKDADALIEKIREKAVYKSSGEPIPVGMIVIDTVRAFSGQDNNVDVLKSVSNKLIEAFPDAAIMWLHHLNKDGETAGGDEFTGVATVNIHFKRYKNYSNGNKKFAYSILDSNYKFFDEDAEANVCLTEDGDFIVVDPERTENEMVEIIHEKYTKKGKGQNKMSAIAAARLLGYKDDSSIRKIKNDNKNSFKTPKKDS